jgi:hypothetical protein
VEKTNMTSPGGDYYSGWTLEILPYAEDQAMRALYDSEVVISFNNLNDLRGVRAKELRESQVPMYSCPSDREMELSRPETGPGTGMDWMTGSYRCNGGRSDGFTTWDLGEVLPLASTGNSPMANSPLTKGWRGPMHAVPVNLPGVNITRNANAIRLNYESPKDITDGLSKTMLVSEYTNLDFTRRRTFWAYTYTYIQSQTVTQSRVFLSEYCGGSGTTCPPAPGPGSCWATGESGTPGQPNSSAGGRVCKRSWFSMHTGGMNMVRCDGSTDFISFDMDLNLFASMGSVAGEDSELEEPTAGPRGGGAR